MNERITFITFFQVRRHFVVIFLGSLHATNPCHTVILQLLALAYLPTKFLLWLLITEPSCKLSPLSTCQIVFLYESTMQISSSLICSLTGMSSMNLHHRVTPATVSPCLVADKRSSITDASCSCCPCLLDGLNLSCIHITESSCNYRP